MANNRLTWQNVAAPNFSGISNNYRVMSDLLSRAAQSGQNALGIFQGAQEENANRAIMQRLAGVQDPAQFDANAIIGPDGQRASLGMLEDVANRPGTLIDWASKRGIENRAQIAHDNIQTDRSEERAARGAMFDYADANYRNDPNAARFLRDPTIRALGGQGFNSAIGYGQTGAAQFTTEQNRQIQDQARTLMVDARRNSDGTPEGVQRYIGNLVDRGQLDPRVAAAAGWQGGFETDPLAGVGSFAGSASSPTGSVGSAPTGSQDPARRMNYRAVEQGVQTLPDTVQTMGDFADWSQDQNRQGMKHTANGLYQIVGSNIRGWNRNSQGYAEKVFGSDWRNVPWDAQNQDRVAQAIFEDHRGSAKKLAGQWEGLTLAEAERIRHLPWEQARETIVAKESSVSPQQLNQIFSTGTQQAIPATQLWQEYANTVNTIRGIPQGGPAVNPQTNAPDFMTPGPQQPTNFVERASAQQSAAVSAANANANLNPAESVSRFLREAENSARQPPTTPQQAREEAVQFASPAFLAADEYRIREQMDLADPENLFQEFQQGVGSSTSLPEAAEGLLPLFEGWTSARLQRELAHIVDEGQVKPAQAATILKIARTDEQFFKAGTWNLSKGAPSTWSRKDIRELINRVTTNDGMAKMIASNAAREQLLAELLAYKQQIPELESERRRLRARMDPVNGIGPTPGLTSRLQLVDTLLEQALYGNAQRVRRNQQDPNLGLTRKLTDAARQEEEINPPPNSSGFSNFQDNLFSTGLSG